MQQHWWPAAPAAPAAWLAVAAELRRDRERWRREGRSNAQLAYAAEGCRDFLAHAREARRRRGCQLP